MKIDGIQLIESSSIKNCVVDTGLVFPTSPDDGQLFYIATGGSFQVGLYIYESGTSQWNRAVQDTDTTITATGISGGVAGDLLVQTAPSTTGFIAPGTNGYVLTMVSGSPAWAVAGGGGGGSVTSVTGTSNQITASPTTGAVVLSIP